MNPETIATLAFAGWSFALAQTLIYVGRWYERQHQRYTQQEK